MGFQAVSSRLPVVFVLAICLFTAVSCAGLGFYRIDFSKFEDEPFPVEAAEWLAGGEQSRITRRIEEAAAAVSCRNRRECMYKGVEFVWSRFRYDNWLNDKSFARTSDALFESRSLGGCADFALVQATLFRALNIPTRMVMTANRDWMRRYKENDLTITTGHVFLEVWLEDRWHLVDPTYRYLFENYDEKSKSYPRNEHFCRRVRDYWDAGIRSVADLDAAYRPVALSFEPAASKLASYSFVEVK